MPDESDSPPVAATAVAVREEHSTRQPAVYSWDREYQKLVKRTVLKPKKREATNAELGMFAEQVVRTGLDPFFGQIYGIYRWDKQAGDEVMKVQAGIDGFRLVAERTGKYEGQAPQEWCGPDGEWTDVWLSDEPPFAARCGVYKTGRRDATYAVAKWSEYVVKNQSGNPDGLWKKMPANQLSKCAEALALRKAFPAELSGLYTVDEMAQASNQRDGGEDVTAGVGGGTDGSGALPDEVEMVLARASALGHAGIAQRGAADYALRARDEDPGLVSAWVEARTRELDRFEATRVRHDDDPPDAEVVVEPEEVASEEELALAKEMEPDAFVEGSSREVRAMALQAARALLGARANRAAHEADLETGREMAERVGASTDDIDAAEREDEEMREAKRRRAEQLLEDAAALEAVGDPERAADAREEAQALLGEQSQMDL